MSNSSRKICVVTGTRAEYGLLRWVIQGIQDSDEIDLQLIVTGMHLSPEFGLTISEIEADGFCIDRKVEMLLSSDTPVGITKSVGLAMIGFADALSQLQPDLLLVLGDRYEIFAAAASAMLACIPIAHCHGGESTEGVIDESIRHSITKMAHLHFVAADPYRRRVIQLGEDPDHVFKVGGLGIDNILNQKLLNKKQFEESIDFRLSERNLLITFHPETLKKDNSVKQMSELLNALSEFHDMGLIFTMPNSDAGGRVLFEQINEFCSNNFNARAYTSLGQLRYLSCIQHVDGVIGNSSSGLLEVPSFKKGTINIGDRQSGRLKALSIIDSAADRNSIRSAINHLLSKPFQDKLQEVVNPYGEGGASKSIVRILEEQVFDKLLMKSFHNIKLD